MRIQRLVPTVLAGVVALLVFSAAPAFAAPLETPVTGEATSITGDSAILHGVLNPNAPGEPATYYFAYKQSTKECRPEATFLEGTALGHEKEAVEREATDLEPGQTYAFCLLEIGETEVQGASVTFTTLPVSRPFVEGGGFTEAVTPFSATLGAYINPEKQETTYAFEYATNEALTGAKTIAGEAPLPAKYSMVSGEYKGLVHTGRALEPSTTYYFRAVATNATGTDKGPVEQFTTGPAEKPIFDGETVTAGSRLQATINPNYQETSYSFECATNEALTENLVKVPGGKLPYDFGELGTPPVSLSGLQPGRTYYYRVVATNNSGTTEGIPVESFVADAVPAVTTSAAETPTRTSAPVSGTIAPQGLATTYHFAYIPQAEYEAAVAKGEPDPYAGVGGKNTYETKLAEENGTSILGYTAQPVGLTLQELQPGTTYDYALVATNELGTITGPNQTFTTTPPTPPLAVTGAAQGVSQRSAEITGTVDTRGLPTTEQFEFGPTPYTGALSSVTVVTSAGTIDSIAHAFTSDLQPGTMYYYRVIASSQDGEVDGAEQSFTTPGFTAALAPPTVLPFVPYTSLAVLQAREAKEGKASAPKALTRGEKLTKALRVCRGERGSRRVGCERKARRRFGPVGKKRAKR